MKEFRSIAIDGPSGAGKSTISRAIAGRLGFSYLDTGAIYRTVGLYIKRRGIDSNNEEGVVSLLGEIKIDIEPTRDTQRMILNGEDVSEDIRKPEISMYASNVSRFAGVRSFLLDMQRSFARTHNVIMDGRDIGTVVLPDADVKIFLTADVEDRARRRFEELKLKGSSVTFEDVLEDMKVRDKNDSSREVAPLTPAADAVIVDTTGNTLEQSIEQIARIIEERL